MATVLIASTGVNTIFGVSSRISFDPSDPLCCQPLASGPMGDDDARELADLLKALADPVRLQIVSLVIAADSGELCACDLPEQLGRSQPTISHHLTKLVSAGLLQREQRGKWAWFRLADRRLAALAEVLRPTPVA